MTKLNDILSLYEGATVLVTGASGFIGRWVARTLCSQRANVNLVVRNKSVAEKIFSKYGVYGNIFEVDLLNSEMVVDLFQRVRPSITFNLAGYGVDPSERDEKTAYQINAYLVEAVCKAMRSIQDTDWSGQDVIHVGSALEYGIIGGNLSEDSTPNPTTLYGKSKLAGTSMLTQYCKTNGVKGLSARLFTVYGPGEHAERLLPSLLETAKTMKPLNLTAGTQKRDFTYVEDVAEGLIRLSVSKAKPGEVVNIATGQLTSVRKFAETAAWILGIPNDKLRFSFIPTREEEMEHSPITIDNLWRLTSWVPPTGIEEGIRKTRDFENRGVCK
jgi:dTDP-glucose 4,6-dehydratase